MAVSMRPLMRASCSVCSFTPPGMRNATRRKSSQRKPSRETPMGLQGDDSVASSTTLLQKRSMRARSEKRLPQLIPRQS
jgi:hypothetical protein